ncbi:MAG: isoprenyl transferase [Desulfobacterales bacterium]|nr:isoprenyl transferase [Desulfobacterales bacterium]
MPWPQGLDPARIPAHVAIIMDGNGRWAKKRLLNRVRGHEKGADTVRTTVRTAREIGLSHLTLFAFSTENWQRPKGEVTALMALLKNFLLTERREMMENGIRLNILGQVHRLPDGVREAIARVTADTGHNRDMTLNLALSYGGRTELVDAARSIAEAVAAGQLDPSAVDEACMADRLYTRDMPDPDLLIRTSGEMRVSNFLLWQIAYAEIFVTETLWPDFNREEFLSILRDYQGRERRFGKVV